MKHFNDFIIPFIVFFRSALRTPTVTFDKNNLSCDENKSIEDEEYTPSSTEYFSARTIGSTTGK